MNIRFMTARDIGPAYIICGVLYFFKRGTDDAYAHAMFEGDQMRSDGILKEWDEKKRKMWESMKFWKQREAKNEKSSTNIGKSEPSKH